MNTIKFEEKKYIILFVRFAIGIAFLSAVADRFGIWGNPGGENVAWGNFENFVAYVTYLNPFLSNTLNIVLAWVVTFIEVILAGMLILGFRLQLASLLSGVLLLSFALSMTIIMGIKVPFDYSVFTASAASFLLYLFLKK